jgi:hypothetical protein
VAKAELTLIAKKSAPSSTIAQAATLLGRKPDAQGPRWGAWRFDSEGAMQKALNKIVASPIDPHFQRSLSGVSSNWLHEGAVSFESAGALNRAVSLLEKRVPNMMIEDPAPDLLVVTVQTLNEVRDVNATLNNAHGIVVARWDVRTQDLLRRQENPMSNWKRSGSSSSATQYIEYATSPDYPGIERITVSGSYHDRPIVRYVIAGKEREFGTPERAMAALTKRSEYAKKAAMRFRNPIGRERAQNPISTGAMAAIGVAVVGAVAVAYEFLKPKTPVASTAPSSSSSTPVGSDAPPPPSPQIYELQPGNTNAPITLVLGNSDLDALPGIVFIEFPTTDGSIVNIASINPPTGVVAAIEEPGLPNGSQVAATGIGTATITGENGAIVNVTVIAPS